MESLGSISIWINKVQAGDEAAIRQLWNQYFPQLVQFARKRLRHSDARMADEEDVALSAFDSYCRHAEQGDYPNLCDLDSLWNLLVTITARKAAHLLRAGVRKKRGSGNGTSLSLSGRKLDALKIDHILSREPDPEFVALMAEECTHLIGALSDRSIADALSYCPVAFLQSLS